MLNQKGRVEHGLVHHKNISESVDKHSVYEASPLMPTNGLDVAMIFCISGGLRFV